MNSSPAGFHWPPWERLRYALRLALLQMTLFLVVYGGASWWTCQHNYRVRWHFDVDLALPLVPAMSLAYLSMNVLLWSAPFILPSRSQLRGLVASLACATLAASPFFVFLPGMDAFPRPSDEMLGIWKAPLLIARTMALQYNYFPSLHVAFSLIAAGAYSHGAGKTMRCFVWCWAALIIASTVLTHQHYLADVAGGLVLGGLTLRWVYRPLTAAVPNLCRSY